MLLTVLFRYTGIALQFIILTVIAHGLTAREYGEYMFCLSAVLPTYFLLGAGASETFVREGPRLAAIAHLADMRRHVGGVFVAMALSAAVVAAIGSLVIMTAPLSATVTAELWFILAFFVANGVMFNAAQVLLGLGFERTGAFFFYPALNLCLLVSSVPYAVMAPHPNFAGISRVTSIAAMGAAVVAWGVVMTRVGPRRPSKQDLRLLVGTGCRLAAGRALYGVGLWLPTFVAGLLLSPTQAGYLGTAGRLAVAVAAVTAAVRFAVRPQIVRAHAAGDVASIGQICARIARVTLPLVGLCVVGALLLGPTVIRAFFGAGFGPVASVLSILLLGVAAEAFGGPVDEVLKMTGGEKQVLAIFGAALPFLGGALIATSLVGVHAMAAAQVAYSATVFGAMIIVAHRRLGIWLSPVASRRSSRVSELGGAGNASIQ